MTHFKVSIATTGENGWWYCHGAIVKTCWCCKVQWPQQCQNASNILQRNHEVVSWRRQKVTFSTRRQQGSYIMMYPAWVLLFRIHIGGSESNTLSKRKRCDTPWRPCKGWTRLCRIQFFMVLPLSSIVVFPCWGFCRKIMLSLSPKYDPVLLSMCVKCCRKAQRHSKLS